MHAWQRCKGAGASRSHGTVGHKGKEREGGASAVAAQRSRTASMESLPAAQPTPPALLLAGLPLCLVLCRRCRRRRPHTAKQPQRLPCCPLVIQGVEGSGEHKDGRGQPGGVPLLRVARPLQVPAACGARTGRGKGGCSVSDAWEAELGAIPCSTTDQPRVLVSNHASKHAAHAQRTNVVRVRQRLEQPEA